MDSSAGKRSVLPDTSIAVIERARAIRKCYNMPQLAFPEWTLDTLTATNASCVVHYDAADNADTVRRTACERELCNFSTVPAFDVAAFSAVTGFSTAYYRRYFEQTHELAPIVTFFCRTPADIAYVGLASGRPTINVLTVPSLMFDHVDQPDYQYYVKSAGVRASELHRAYERIYSLIFRAAKRHGCTTVVMPLVGSGIAAQLFPGGLQNSYIAPAIATAVRAEPSVTPFLIGAAGGNVLAALRASGVVIDDIGLFPQCVNLFDNATLPSVLFVNSGDPIALPGNGHDCDGSLNGRIGRCTAIGVLAPLLNPNATFEAL